MIIEFDDQLYEVEDGISEAEVVAFFNALEKSKPKYSEKDVDEQFAKRLEKLPPGTYKFGNEIVEID